MIFLLNLKRKCALRPEHLEEDYPVTKFFENKRLIHSLRTADAFSVVASLPPKNSVCEPERQNDFRDVKPF